MEAKQKPEAPANNTKAPAAKVAPMRVDGASERAMRSCWMPIWRPVVESGGDQTKPSNY